MSSMLGKPVSASAIHDQAALIMPNDLNAHGTLFGGRVLEMADRVAAVVARRHTGRVCVTLGLDSVRFLAPTTIRDILVFKASLNRVWRSSMEVGLKAFAEDTETGQRRHIFSAYFTCVAVDDELKPVETLPVIAETEEEKRRYREADERRRMRMGQGK